MPLQMFVDKLHRGDGLGMVSGGGEWCEVAVLRYDVVCARGDRAIGENIVVRVVVDDLEMVLGSRQMIMPGAVGFEPH